MWLPYIGDLVVEEAWAGPAGVLPGLGVAGGGPAGVLPGFGLGVAGGGPAGMLPGLGLGVAGGGPAGVLPGLGLGVAGGGPAGVLPCDGGPSCRARAGVPLPRRRRAQAALFTLWGRG